MTNMPTRTTVLAACALTFFSSSRAITQDSAAERTPALAVASANLTIAGGSNRGTYLASTKTLRVTRVELADPPSTDVLQKAAQPGELKAFDVTIPVMSLTSPDRGVEEHLREALKAESHPEIRFQLRAMKSGAEDASGAVSLRADGMLTIAGVERPVTLNIKAVPAGRHLIVEATTDLLMTDFAVKPPKGMLGMLKTEPAVRVHVYLVLTQAKE